MTEPKGVRSAIPESRFGATGIVRPGDCAKLPPREGHLALFPSSHYHGTKGFDSAAKGETGCERMTVAFDVMTQRY